MFTIILKRSGQKETFQPQKITKAIFKAAQAVGGEDYARAQQLSDQVVDILRLKFADRNPGVEDIQDIVERVLIKNGHAKTAKAYILYREKRKGAREANALIGATIDMFSSYLSDTDWNTRENANTQRSVNGLNNYIREAFTKSTGCTRSTRRRCAKRTSRETATSTTSGSSARTARAGICGSFNAGLGGIPGKVESKPANHLRSFLGQVVNSTFTTQGETAGAQAWSSFDTYCAPFVRRDHMTHSQIKQCLQEFIFNINVPTRVGFQCPFSNLTFDIKVPSTLKDHPVIIGGQHQDTTYGDYQEEMDRFNLAFCDVMLEGDAKGRVFTFPIPTLNITKNFDWNTPVVDKFMDITCKYGIPYFANYVNSDLSPEDAVSMCCRLRLDVTELRKRGGGLFGSNPLTGSIGVFTINLPRIGYLSDTREELFARLKKIAEVGRTSLEIKRKIIEHQTENGLYPYSAVYLRDVKKRSGQYWFNHFNTIGIIGMHEALLNFMGKGIETPEGNALAVEIMNYLRALMQEFQKETGHSYNLEATPAEGTSYRLAKLDKERYFDIITSGRDVPYYTNSSQLPVGYTDDIMEMIEMQDELQSLYTGGTVQHLYLGERIEDIETAKRLIQKIFTRYRMPYISITPTFSVCDTHGYLAGEQFTCPECGAKTEVWSRVVGYLRPVQNFNEGKKEEYRERVKFVIPEAI
jgi:anaerobic ribonucleoside-triphosphate reductase